MVLGVWAVAVVVKPGWHAVLLQCHSRLSRLPVLAAALLLGHEEVLLHKRDCLSTTG